MYKKDIFLWPYTQNFKKKFKVHALGKDKDDSSQCLLSDL